MKETTLFTAHFSLFTCGQCLANERDPIESIAQALDNMPTTGAIRVQALIEALPILLPSATDGRLASYMPQ